LPLLRAVTPPLPTWSPLLEPTRLLLVLTAPTVLPSALPQVTAPTLVVAGLSDEASPPAHAQRIVDLIPRARLALVSGAAHLANVSRPDLIAELLTDFLTDTAIVHS